MTFSIKLVRRPKSIKRVTKTVQAEVRIALNGLADKHLGKLEFEVRDWNDKPKFKRRISISDKEWIFKLGYDSNTEAGTHFKWVDEGTGKRGGNEAYDIYPKNGKTLTFVYPPHMPKTLPTPRVAGLIKLPPAVLNKRKHVLAPGIYPRNFSKNMHEDLRSRTKVGGYRSTVEAAIKRAFRKEKLLK
jgi:hypothetical protein